jgi:hypothetical protein
VQNAEAVGEVDVPDISKSQFYDNFRKTMKAPRPTGGYIRTQLDARTTARLKERSRAVGRTRLRALRRFPTLALTASSMKTWVWLLLALASGAAQAEIYACSKHGATTYQNFPCRFDSLGSMPTDAKVTTSAAATSPSNSSLQKPRDAASAKVTSSAAIASTGSPSIPRVGATREEVRKMWGEPVEVIQDEPRKGRVEIWRYKDGRTVEMDRGRRVIAVQL